MGVYVGQSKENLASPPKETIRDFFDTIAPRYDPINTLLSLGLDETWRAKAVRMVLDTGRKPLTILDLGVGTGKFLKGFLKNQSWELAAGLDFSSSMLQRAKIDLPESTGLIQGDIHELPFTNESFDLVVSSFTLRSVKDLPSFFRGVHRILRPCGRAAFLCLTRPTTFLMKPFYVPYLKFYLPFIGGLISSDRKAYRFLSESIQTFPSPDQVMGHLRTNGFSNVSARSFTFGISTLTVAEK